MSPERRIAKQDTQLAKPVGALDMCACTYGHESGACSMLGSVGSVDPAPWYVLVLPLAIV